MRRQKSVKSTSSKVKQPATSRLSRKQWLLIAAGVVALLVAGLIVYQIMAWGAYVERQDSTYTNARDTAQQALSADDLSEESLTTLGTDVQSASDELCQGAPLLSAIHTSLSQAAQEEQDTCLKRKTQLEEAHRATTELTTLLETEQAVAELMNDTQAALKKTKEAAYADQRQVWNDAKASLEDQREQLSQYAGYQSQLDAVETIIKRYQTLEKAAKSEKRTQFDDAVVDLQKAYGALSETTEKAQTQYREAAERLVAAVNAL